MKTFNDLEFKPHGCAGDLFPPAILIQDETRVGDDSRQARMDFDNGYGISVVTGSSFFHIDENGPYEVALFNRGHIGYDDDRFIDVVGYCDEDAVTELMAYIQAKPAI